MVRMAPLPDFSSAAMADLAEWIDADTAHLIYRALDITPVRITCSPLTLGKGDKWYRVPPTRFHMVIDVQEDLPIAPFLNGTEGADPSAGGEALAARRLTEYLANYFAGDPSRAGT